MKDVNVIKPDRWSLLKSYIENRSRSIFIVGFGMNLCPLSQHIWKNVISEAAKATDREDIHFYFVLSCSDDEKEHFERIKEEVGFKGFPVVVVFKNGKCNGSKIMIPDNNTSPRDIINELE